MTFKKAKFSSERILFGLFAKRYQKRLLGLVRLTSRVNPVAKMSDELDNLPLIEEEPHDLSGGHKPKKTWKDVLKNSAVALGCFLVVANPMMTIMLSGIPFLQGPYRTFAVQALLFFVFYWIANTYL